jgi:hypothetical protein
MRRDAQRGSRVAVKAGSSVVAATFSLAVQRQHQAWQRGGNVWLGSTAAARLQHGIIGTWLRKPPPTLCYHRAPLRWQ